MGRLSLCVLLIGVVTLTMAMPQYESRHGGGSDPYTPVIDFLRQLRKARKHSGSVIGNRDGEEGTPSFTISHQNQNSQQNSQNSQQNSQQSQTSTPILFPSGGGGGGGGGNSPSFGSSSPNDQKINIQLPATFPNFPSPTSSPADITRVNSGVSTILQGVRSFDLGQILRGAFIFPRNENVKKVANNVLDNIFGEVKLPSQ